MRIFSTQLGSFVTLSLYAYALSGSLAWGAVGIPLPESQLPVQVCMIQFFGPNGELEETCSATLISSHHLHSAGHCFYEKGFESGGAKTAHAVVCPNGERAKIELTRFGNRFSEIAARQKDEMRRFDSVLLRVDHAVSLPAMPVLLEKKAVLSLLQGGPECALFGYGGLAPSDPAYGKLKGTRVNPTAIEVKPSGMIHLHGIGGWNSGLVEGGDSGGSLACRASGKGTWVHLANISARNYDHGSYLAPLFLSPELFEGMPEKSSLDSSEGEKKARLIFIRREAESGISSVARILSRLDPDKLASLRAALEFSSARDGNALLKKIELVRSELISQSIGKKLRLLTFTLVQLDLSSFELDGAEMLGEFRAEKNPFSMGDQAVSQFELEKIEGGFATGKLQIFGNSDYFSYAGCKQNVICVPGTFRNVRVPLSGLDLSVLR